MTIATVIGRLGKFVEASRRIFHTGGTAAAHAASLEHRKRIRMTSFTTHPVPRTMIRLARKTLRAWGVIAFKRSSAVYIPDDEGCRILASLGGTETPTVIDGGAHKGVFVDDFRKVLPQAQFHCFEPAPQLYAALSERFVHDARVRVVQAALGEAVGTATFHLNADQPSNSLLPAGVDLPPDLANFYRTVSTVEVPVTTIDTYLQENRIGKIDILKLDLQGYDLFALRGAEQALASARVVVAEVMFKPLYCGCGMFGDIFALMREHGFDLYTLFGLHYGPGDELLWGDAIFVRAGAAPTS